MMLAMRARPTDLLCRLCQQAARSLTATSSRVAPKIARARVPYRLFYSTPLRSTNFDAPFTTISESGFTSSQLQVREAIQAITNNFDLQYWYDKDKREEYPHELYDSLQKDGWIGITLPIEYGGAGLGISEATIMLQTIAESGAGVSGAQSIHANVYPIMPIKEFASDEQRKSWLPAIIEGKIRSCFMITEPNVGLETLKLKTKAEKKVDKWVINGSKVRVCITKAINRSAN